MSSGPGTPDRATPCHSGGGAAQPSKSQTRVYLHHFELDRPKSPKRGDVRRIHSRGKPSKRCRVVGMAITECWWPFRHGRPPLQLPCPAVSRPPIQRARRDPHGPTLHPHAAFTRVSGTDTPPHKTRWSLYCSAPPSRYQQTPAQCSVHRSRLPPAALLPANGCARHRCLALRSVHTRSRAAF